MLSANPCNLCPRMCGVDRTKQSGFCGCGGGLKVARAALHFGEEPCISARRGSGTVFFSGCTLRCCFCQNQPISSGGFGKEITVPRLAEIFLDLQAQGAHNISLVTPTQYLPWVLPALDLVKPALHIPVVYNCGGYERVETIRSLKGYVDVYLPDFKFFSPELSRKYAKAGDYFQVASAAIAEMTAQTGGLSYDAQGLLQKGVLIRHLVLPGARKDSLAVLKWIHENLPHDRFLLSLMSQYTPGPENPEYPELNRRVTSFEYDSVAREAVRLGLTNGFLQARSSAKKDYTPPFDLTGV